MTRPFSQACENNKEPILAVIADIWTTPCRILEIGSGTGQHAVHFASRLPHIVWQPSDRKDAMHGMQAWLDDAGLDNILPPVALDVQDDPWPVNTLQGVFTANTLHIMSMDNVRCLFHRLGRYLVGGARFVCYGPFNSGGRYTSDSNARFDVWLKSQDPASGIRDIGDLQVFASAANIRLIDSHDMPANNRILVWEKSVAGIDTR